MLLRLEHSCPVSSQCESGPGSRYSCSREQRDGPLPTGSREPCASFDPFDPSISRIRTRLLPAPPRSAGRYSAELDYWTLSRYVDVRTAFRDATRFSASNALTPIQPRSATAAAFCVTAIVLCRR